MEKTHFKNIKAHLHPPSGGLRRGKALLRSLTRATEGQGRKEKMSEETKNALEGVCAFYSETGTEGGYWAFQEKRFIIYVSPPYGIWENQTVWDLLNPNRKGKTRNDVKVLRDGKWCPLPDPIERDPDYFISSLFRGEERGDRDADKRLMKKYGFIIKYAADQMDERYGKGNWHLEKSSTAVTSDGTRVFYGGTPKTEPDRPYGVRIGELTRATVEWENGVIEQRLSDSLLVVSWNYEGLHILKDGDQLTIYSKDDPNKIVWSGTIKLRQYPLFTEDAFGMWIHADQEGVDRKTWAKWFFEEYPAKLIVA